MKDGDVHIEVCTQFREQFEALRALQIVECTRWAVEPLREERVKGCSVCGHSWPKGEEERHGTGCIAGPFTKKEVAP